MAAPWGLDETHAASIAVGGIRINNGRRGDNGTMGLLTSALGAFYVVAAYLALKQARLEWFIDGAHAALTKENRLPVEQSRLYFVTISACLYGLAGLALLLGSRLAVWFLGGGLIAQAVYYGFVWLRLTQAERADEDRWRKALNAALISTAAFAFAAYAVRVGVLS
jgi:hypothetical protein